MLKQLCVWYFHTFIHIRHNWLETFSEDLKAFYVSIFGKCWSSIAILALSITFILIAQWKEKLITNCMLYVVPGARDTRRNGPLPNNAIKISKFRQILTLSDPVAWFFLQVSSGGLEFMQTDMPVWTDKMNNRLRLHFVFRKLQNVKKKNCRCNEMNSGCYTRCLCTGYLWRLAEK
jgi:hypothetical protein